ncbi:MAG: DsrE/DsrF/DrsH-like family protein [Candidatus Heimdallarchaeota archaeon]|nr:DsrE/DsrF/DrsH-like family protein [Candidatus Heimdallarchaeota archaeon]
MKLSILLKDGSLNNMITLGTIVAGAVTIDYEINIFVTDAAVWSFRKDMYDKLEYVYEPIPGFAEALKAGIENGTVQKWYELLEDLKDFGEVNITLCSLMADIQSLSKDDFIDIVDRLATVGTYMEDISDADKTITL